MPPEMAASSHCRFGLFPQPYRDCGTAFHMRTDLLSFESSNPNDQMEFTLTDQPPLGGVTEAQAHGEG